MNDATRTARLVVGICADPPSRPVIELAAELAALFGASFSAMMIDDGSPDILGSLPFAREYVAYRAQWRDIGNDDVESRREQAYRRARDLFSQIANAKGLQAEFEVLSGRSQDELSAAIAQYDIVALAAPALAGGWMMLPFSAFGEAVLQSPAAVLILPPRILRRTGPIALLASTGDRAAIEFAVRLARESGENFVFFCRTESVTMDFVVLAESVDLPRGRLRIIDVDGVDLQQIGALLAGIGERILILGRELIPHPALQRLIAIAASRSIPVLLPATSP